MEKFKDWLGAIISVIAIVAMFIVIGQYKQIVVATELRVDKQEVKIEKLEKDSITRDDIQAVAAELRGIRQDLSSHEGNQTQQLSKIEQRLARSETILEFLRKGK